MPGLRLPGLSPSSAITPRAAALKGLLVVALAGALLAADPGAASAACPSPNGDAVGFPSGSDTDRFVFRGRGFGHGVGMSQWGAQGAASLGCTGTEILQAYYPGLELSSLTDAEQPQSVVVGLRQEVTDWTRVRVGTQGEVPWSICNGDGSGCGSHWTGRQQPGTTWRVRPGTDGRFEVDTGTQTHHVGGPDRLLRLDVEHDGLQVDTTLEEVGRTTRWGWVQFDSYVSGSSHGLYATAHIDGASRPALDRYLWGLAEVPSSWPNAALASQAVAARSFAARRVMAGLQDSCLCHLYATTVDQHWVGADQVDADRGVGGDWKNAVDTTSGQIGRYGGAVAEMLYSSSSGGHTESAEFVWGGEVAYLRAVEDGTWSQASDDPNRQWSVTVTAQELGQVAGVGTALTVETPAPHGDSGRVGDPARGYGGVRILGTQGTVTRSGDWVRRQLGLRSTLFRVTNPTGAACLDDPSLTQPFTDIDPAHPFCNEIAWMGNTGISEGYPDGTYRPQTQVTRQAMAAFMARLAGASPTTCTEPPFTDVPTDHTFCEEITWMADQNITTGYPDGTYRPANDVTRQAMAAFMARLAGASPTTCTEPPFTDVPTDHTFCEEITWMADQNITTGYPDGTYRPANDVTRQAMAAFMHRLGML